MLVIPFVWKEPIIGEDQFFIWDSDDSVIPSLIMVIFCIHKYSLTMIDDNDNATP